MTLQCCASTQTRTRDCEYAPDRLFLCMRVCAELRQSSTRASFESVRAKMLHLGSLYSRSERFFPMEFLALTLEKHACERSWDVASVCSLFLEMGVPLMELFKVYDKLFKAKVRDHYSLLPLAITSCVLGLFKKW